MNGPLIYAWVQRACESIHSMCTSKLSFNRVVRKPPAAMWRNQVDITSRSHGAFFPNQRRTIVKF
jgi:hypothetical protein